MNEFILEPEEEDIIYSVARDEYEDDSEEVFYYVAVEYIIEREGFDRDYFMIDYQNFRTYVLYDMEPGDFHCLQMLIPNLKYLL